MLAQGLPVDCSEHQTLLPSDAKCSSSTPFKNTSHSSHALCISPQGNWGTGMQDCTEHPSKPGSPLLRAHQWRQNHLEQQGGDIFLQQVPRRSWLTNGCRRELPGEETWLMQLARSLYQGGKGGSPPVARVLSFFFFSYLFGSRTIQIQMRPGSEPVDCSSFQLNRNRSNLINKSLQMRRERFMH